MRRKQRPKRMKKRFKSWRKLRKPRRKMPQKKRPGGFRVMMGTCSHPPAFPGNRTHRWPFATGWLIIQWRASQVKNQ